MSKYLIIITSHKYNIAGQQDYIWSTSHVIDATSPEEAVSKYHSAKDKYGFYLYSPGNVFGHTPDSSHISDIKKIE